MNRVGIGSNNDLSPVRRQAIIQNNSGLLSIRLLGTNFSDFFLSKCTIFHSRNAPENILCEKADFCLAGDDFDRFPQNYGIQCIFPLRALYRVFCTIWSNPSSHRLWSPPSYRINPLCRLCFKMKTCNGSGNPWLFIYKKYLYAVDKTSFGDEIHGCVGGYWGYNVSKTLLGALPVGPSYQPHTIVNRNGFRTWKHI